jgi:hypothetical protein
MSLIHNKTCLFLHLKVAKVLTSVLSQDYHNVTSAKSLGFFVFLFLRKSGLMVHL